MKGRKIHIINDGAHDFTLKSNKDGNKFIFKRSKTGWSIPGEVIAKVIDDGNGIKINDKHFDYIEMSEMFAIFSALKHIQVNEWSKTELIEK